MGMHKTQQVGVLAIIRDLEVVGKIWTQEESHGEVVCGKFFEMVVLDTHLPRSSSYLSVVG